MLIQLSIKSCVDRNVYTLKTVLKSQDLTEMYFVNLLERDLLIQ